MGYVETELLDANLNLIATVRSLQLSLQAGQQLSYTSIPWNNQVSYGGGTTATNLRTRGQLYTGDFVVCHTFMETGGTELARNCVEKRAELNVNFSLIYPADRSNLEQLRPSLVWEQVAQFALNTSGITYELKLVELNNGQSAAEALERNVPLLQQRNLTTTSLWYPADARPLEFGRTYAWMVRVFQNQNEILISQPWRFSLSETETDVPEVLAASYVMPSHDIDSRIYTFSSAIYLAFDNNEGLKSLDYSVSEISGDLETVASLPVIDKLKAGLNTFTIPTSAMSLENGRIYRLTIRTPQKRSYFLQFRFVAK